MRHSVTTRISSVVFIAFLLAAATVVSLADVHMSQIIDASQRAVYEEKLNTILRILNGREARLAATGIRAAYEDAFQEAALKDLQQTYASSGRGCFFFVMDLATGRFLNSAGPGRDVLRMKALDAPDGEFVYRGTDMEQVWCLVKRFPPWNWAVGYSVPFSEKYADVENFRLRVLAPVTVILALVMAAVLLVIRRTIWPIKELTAASEAMAAGELDREIRIRGRDELASLAASFTAMRDSIRSQMDELRRLRNYMQNIINSMPSMLVGVDPEGRVTQWNLEAEKATGLAADMAVGRRLDAIMPQLAAEMEKVRRAIRERRIEKNSRVASNGNGATRYSDITIYPLIANGVEGAVIRVDDITDRVRIEEMMIQTEKMMSVGGLAAGMAHEINNPLAGIMQNIQVLGLYLLEDTERNRRMAEQCGIRPDALREFLSRRDIPAIIDNIMTSGRQAAKIVDNMLSFSRKSEHRFSSAAIPDILDRSIDLAAKDYDLKKKYDFRKIRISRRYHDDLPGVMCEPGQIQQVFLNILKNGAQAMSMAATPDPSFELTVRRDGEWIVVEIADNGPGMDEDTRRRAFEPFFTTKEVGVGTGLGLSVSYFIVVENHGGRMEVASSPGRGARFIIRLPLDGEGADG